VASAGSVVPNLRRRYTVLFYSLLFTLVAGPVSAALRFGGGLIELFLAANLLMAVIPVAKGRTRSLLIGGVAVLLTARLATAWLVHPALSAIALGMWTVVALGAAAAALRFAMQSRAVNAEQLYAALSAYLLAGVFLGLLYWVLQQVWPSTFVTATGEFSRTSAVYFSFVTLATLGYGDIVPRSDLARGLAVVEGIGGQLFLAVLVARLVSSYVREKDHDG
jgi:voltage-gated potassium channel